MKRLLIVVVLAVFAAGGIAVFVIGRRPKVEYRFAAVERGDVMREVSVVGRVVPNEELDMAFLRAGTIERLPVEVGNRVSSGTLLAVLGTRSLTLDRAAAVARLELAEAKLAQSKAGSTGERIRVTETAMRNAEISLEKARAERDAASVTVANAELSLANVEAKASDDLSKLLANSLEKAKTALTANDKSNRTFKEAVDKYFLPNTPLSLKVRDAQQRMRNAYLPAETAVNAAIAETSKDNTVAVLSALDDSLSEARDALLVLRSSLDDPSITVATADKSSIDTERAAIDTQLTAVVGALADIASQDVANKKSVDAARSDLESAEAKLDVAESTVRLAEGELRKAEDELALVRSGPRSVDLALFLAEIDQARAEIAKVDKDIEDSSLKAPIDGVVTAVDRKPGERVTTGEAVVSLISIGSQRVEADVSELDIAPLSAGQPVRATFDAFGASRVFDGQVTKIDPREKIKEGDTYYMVTAVLEDAAQEIRPGMTADLSIETGRSADTLFLPRRVVTISGGSATVRVLGRGVVTTKAVEIGLVGKDTVEILGGLALGEEVILSAREP